MDPILDRRDERSERVRVRLAVELGHGDFRDAFEADALNVSKGGISVRAACLPDLHSRLLCRFQCASGGASVTALGEVVWAHLDGDKSGEFGLAFVDLDPKTEWLIEELIAEHAAQRDGRGPTHEAAASVATLELEGSAEPIAARVARDENGRAVFEQALDLLSLGRGVLARAEGWQGRAGSISGVELRMVGSVPMLAVTVSFEDALTASSSGELEHDTEPDLKAPGAAPSVTVAEFGRREEEPVLEERGTAEARPPAWALSPLDHPPRANEGDELEIEELSVMIEAAPEPAMAVRAHAAPEAAPAPSAPLARLESAFAVGPSERRSIADRENSRSIADRENSRAITERENSRAIADRENSHSIAEREFSRAFKLPEPTDVEAASPAGADDDELDLELEAFSGPSYKPIVLAAFRALGSGFAALFRALSTASASGSRSAAPKVRGVFLRSGKALRSLYGREVGLRVGAARRMVGAALPSRRRRTTGPASANQKRKASGSLRRTLVLGIFGAAAAGLAVYALAPSRRDDSLALRRNVQPLPAPSEEPSAMEPAEAKASSANNVANAVSAPTIQATAAAADAPRPPSSALPSEQRVPATSPYAVDVRATQAAKAESGHKLRFGAAQVPKGRRFALRMSARVQTLEGVPDKGGFTVTVPGVLSLDRAGPISSAVKSVKRAMVVNKGDHAELSIRFADGKQPAYQVSAEGTTLYLVIEDAP